MAENSDTRVKIIENATIDDVLPGDHITWEGVTEESGVTRTVRREGVAHHRDSADDWRTEGNAWITWGEGDGVTITIRRTAQDFPTKSGTVLAPADGHEYITATVFGETYRAREAILIGKTQWHAAWRSDEGVLIYVAPGMIDADTWKVDGQ